jgi:signal transduction histidine kinase
MNLWFFGIALAAACWVFGVAAFLLVDSASAALNWATFYYIPPLVIGASSVIFAQTFPSGGATRTAKSYLVIAGMLVLAGFIIFWPDFLFKELIFHSWGKEIVLNKLPYLVYSAYLLLTFYLTLVPIYQKTRTEKGLYKAQANVLFDGYIISCILGVFFNLILPWFGNYQLIWIGPLATNFYVIATAYGIIRHRLFDVRIVAARSVGYLLSILALSALYGILAYAVITLLLDGEVASVQERAVSAALAVLLALTFRPIKRFFDRITNKLFYRDAYETAELIDRLNHVLVSTIELHKLLADTAKLLQLTFKAQYCSYILTPQHTKEKTVTSGTKRFDQEMLATLRSLAQNSEDRIVFADYLDSMKDKKMRAKLQAADISVIAFMGPGNVQDKTMLGYLVLGPKKSGNLYTNQDIKALGVVVNELVIAIQNALRFEEIEQFNVTLQQKIDEATKKLRRTNERLRVLDQTKDDFISMASHQLRTPLTSVKGYVSMVLDGDAGRITATQRKLLNQSFVSAQRMVYLISDLLNVSRLKTGKFIIEPTPTNLARVIQEEVDQLQETAKGRNLQLTYRRPEHFPLLMLDETKIRQVMMNFIDNAIYYTPSGGHIEIYLAEKPQSIEFTVIDDGIGVPRHEQHHLFGKFYRAHNAKRARPDGTGLGLFMAKKVIIAQGGAIIFKSQEGKGSTFGFTFAKHRMALPLQKEP